ncbi:hypothetical protein DOTSEDRAFT_71876, partial [Dothistroma septosporum NZE10]
MANVPYSTSTASAAGPIPSGDGSGSCMYLSILPYSLPIICYAYSSSAACNSNGDTQSQIPWGFDNNSTAFCGFSYPPSSQPLRTLQDCCEGPVMVSN